MPKRVNPERKKAEVLFRKGLKLVDIAEKLGIPEGTVRRWKKEYTDAANDSGERSKKNVQNERKTNAAFARPGNVNAVGNSGGGPPGNKKAEIHGLYAKYLPEETMEIMDGLANQSPLDSLWDQILNQRALILRSQKIFEQKRGEKTVEITSETGDGTTYMVQEPWDKEAQYITAFSRAQATLQSMIKTYYEMEGQTKQEAAAGAKDWKTAILEIAKRRQKANGDVDT